MSQPATIKINVQGHVLITDATTGEVVLDKDNAVHTKNMALAIAKGLATAQGSALANGAITSIKLGNGGSTVTGTSETINFLPPNVTGGGANLYNATYSEIVSGITTPAGNSVEHQQSPAPLETAIVIVTATIAAGDVTGQATSDQDPNSMGSAFAFDELGLFTSDDKMLTHIVFAPILKTVNRELVITYTLTISVS